MSMKINAAIQLLPLKSHRDKIALIDAAIKLIADSGLPYQVCPFETVVEGESDQVYHLLRQIQDFTLASDCEELILNVKIHAGTSDLAIEDKMQKYSAASVYSSGITRVSNEGA